MNVGVSCQGVCLGVKEPGLCAHLVNPPRPPSRRTKTESEERERESTTERESDREGESESNTYTHNILQCNVIRYSVK